jgi:hypothetical protein
MLGASRFEWLARTRSPALQRRQLAQIHSREPSRMRLAPCGCRRHDSTKHEDIPSSSVVCHFKFDDDSFSVSMGISIGAMPFPACSAALLCALTRRSALPLHQIPRPWSWQQSLAVLARDGGVAEWGSTNTRNLAGSQTEQPSQQTLFGSWGWHHPEPILGLLASCIAWTALSVAICGFHCGLGIRHGKSTQDKGLESLR